MCVLQSIKIYCVQAGLYRVSLLTCVLVTLVLNSSAQDLSNLQSADPLVLKGNIAFQSELYSASGIPDRRNPSQYILSGSPTLSLYGIDFNFHFLISNIRPTFGHPFNQIGICPSYKWVKIHLGYQNLDFSPYTLQGRRVFGAGFELTPGKWRIGFMQGRLQQALVPDGESVGIVPGTAVFAQPQYKRVAWGAMISYGNLQKGHIKISAFQGRDIASSLPPITGQNIPKPESNSAVSLAFGIPISDQLVWENEIALSIYTRNTNSDEFIIQEEDFSWINRILSPRVSNQYLTAVRSALRYRMKQFETSVQYLRLDPDFESMGSIYLQNDLQQWRLAGRWRNKMGALSLNASLGLQQDNVLDLKRSTSRRVIANGNLNWQPVPVFGISAMYGNYGVTRQRDEAFGTDTFGLRQINKSYSVNPRFSWKREGTSQMITGSISLQELSTTQPWMAQNQNTQSFVAALNHQFTFQQSGLSIGSGISHLRQMGDLIDMETWGITASANLNRKNKRFQNFGLHTSVMSNVYEGNTQGYTLRVTVNTNLKSVRSIPILFRAEMLHNHAGTTAAEGGSQFAAFFRSNFTEWRLTMRFNINFQTNRKPIS